MTEISYDLHIHSCLSPCGDDESTPSSIAQLGSILELNAVALTDHNTCKNCPAFFETAKQLDIVPIAGMELTTAEEIHVLCLFPELENAMAFDKEVEKHLPPIMNNPAIYGNQNIVDAQNNILGTFDKLLINATDIDLYLLSDFIRPYSGIIVPAHIDRTSFSLISALGFVPDENGFDCVEIRYKEAVENLKATHQYLNVCRIIHDSDAHRLEDMSLPVNMLNIEEKTAKGVLKALSAHY